jgi:DNA polymerase III subunit gamma/tau
MSYQVLARKWRPQNFKQMVGQEHVLKALIHALESQRLHHAYLFTGTRGVGKTTIGRILAKCLSCHKGITAEPCGQCGACTSITEGRYVDLIEIDAASRTKVEDMRELLENVQYAPSEGRFKIYLIDEVHMLSQSSFNALLKTLEEPPEHVKFLFATTDPQKLPVTILSRCLQFNLKNMSPERIVSHLQYILAQEQVTFEEMALWALARAADGSMRDALSLTDQAIAYGNHALTEVGVSAMLGTVDQKKIYRILDSLIERNAAKMLAEVKALAEFSPNYASVLATLSEILHRVAIEQAVPGACDNAMGDQQQVVAYAAALCAEDVQLFYQVALVSRQDLAITPDPKSGLEMALLRMLAFQLNPSEQNAAPIENAMGESAVIDAEEGGTVAELSHSLSAEPVSGEEYPTGANSRPEEPVVEQVVEQVVEPAVEAEVLASYPEPVYDSSEVSGLANNESEDLAKKKNPLNVDPGSAETVLAEATCSESGASIAPSAIALAEDKLVEPLAEVLDAPDQVRPVSVEATGWNRQVTQMGLSGMTLNLLLNSVLEEDNECLKVYFEAGHYRLLNSNHEKRIREALQAHMAQGRVLELIEGLDSKHETPMMWRERVRAEMVAEAKVNIQRDPYVQQMLSEFDGMLIESSIQSLGKIS